MEQDWVKCILCNPAHYCHLFCVKYLPIQFCDKLTEQTRACIISCSTTIEAENYGASNSTYDVFK